MRGVDVDVAGSGSCSLCSLERFVLVETGFVIDKLVIASCRRSKRTRLCRGVSNGADNVELDVLDGRA